eukprot:CAMPEP_0172364544 /NCGR_PEP_ID=MMETSP1060-20121228/7639_1 /TAXON_ID=37318 /ORGANISM="Pseudo-nitzschia pungens, Strain cf. cingulata" /LENGTH=106 /DNA_ID=CAMNT_0013087569 /DNA_START=4402 /DNA_END=4722 /DNA_ORIENTATION=+
MQPDIVMVSLALHDSHTAASTRASLKTSLHPVPGSTDSLMSTYELGTSSQGRVCSRPAMPVLQYMLQGRGSTSHISALGAGVTLRSMAGASKYAWPATTRPVRPAR